METACHDAAKAEAQAFFQAHQQSFAECQQEPVEFLNRCWLHLSILRHADFACKQENAVREGLLVAKLGSSLFPRQHFETCRPAACSMDELKLMVAEDEKVVCGPSRELNTACDLRFL